MTDEITIDQVELDIAITQSERDAYIKLESGHLTLANLPGQDPAKARIHSYEASKYRKHTLGCDEFLKQLIQIKKELEKKTA